MVVKFDHDLYPELNSLNRPHVMSLIEQWLEMSRIEQCKNYLFASMDDDTRYWLANDIADSKFHHNADSLLQLAKL